MSKLKAELIGDNIVFVGDDSTVFLEDSKQDILEYFQRNPLISFIITDLKINFNDCSTIEHLSFNKNMPNIPFFVRNTSEKVLANTFVEAMQHYIQKGFLYSHVAVVGCEVNFDH